MQNEILSIFLNNGACAHYSVKRLPKLADIFMYVIPAHINIKDTSAEIWRFRYRWIAMKIYDKNFR